MPLFRSRNSLTPPIHWQPVPVWGAEPIGAATATSLQGQLNAAAQSQSGQWVGWGESGSVETTSQQVIAPLQAWVGGLGGPLAQVDRTPWPSPLPGLPGTSIPPGLKPFGIGQWWSDLVGPIQVQTGT